MTNEESATWRITYGFDKAAFQLRRSVALALQSPVAVRLDDAEAAMEAVEQRLDAIREMINTERFKAQIPRHS